MTGVQTCALPISLLIMTKLEQYKYADATAIALVLLVISFLLMLFINSVQLYMQRFNKG